MPYDIASLILRAAVGVFFVISGYHKLFNVRRRASLAATFKADGVYSPVTMLAIPCGELAGGLGLIVGLATPIACLGLILICAGACIVDGLKRIPAFQPIDRADYVADVLYLPEVLYVFMMCALLCIGGGKYSLDAVVYPYLQHLIH